MSLLNNAKWVALSQSIKIILQIISLTVLARLLSPKEYGLMSMAIVVTNFALIVRDLGTTAAIVQRKELNLAIKSTVFWLNIIMGVVICVLIMAFSPVIASLFKSDALIPVLLLVALSFPIASMASIHQALLERDSCFRIVATIEIKSSCIGLAVALGMAHQGMGVYSLVGQSLAVCFLSTLQLWRASVWRPSWLFDKDEIRHLFSFSGNLTAFNFINYFSRNTDGMIIGHFFSAAILGAYSLAYRIMLFPLQSLTFVISRSLYPIMSRKQEQTVELKNLYLRIVTIIASITAPMMFGLAILREPFVNLIFGFQWELVPTLLIWLAPTGFIQSIVSTTGSVFMAKGKTHLLMRLGILGAVLQVGAFVIGAKYDITYICLLYFLANLLNAIPALYFTMRLLHGNLFELLSTVFAPVITSLLMALYLIVVRQHLDKHLNIFSFGLIVFSSVVVYVVIYRCLFSGRLKNICPAKLHKFIGFNS